MDRVLIHPLSPGVRFEKLSLDEKLYAHHMSRAAWHGSRIIFRQVSAESENTFDLIIELYKYCEGDWEGLVRKSGASLEFLPSFLDFCGRFLSNVGNYYGSGDQKIVLRVPEQWLLAVSSVSERAQSLCQGVLRPLLNTRPLSLGFPGKDAQTTYYVGNNFTRNEIEQISQHVGLSGVEPENTRICKEVEGRDVTYEVLQASTERDQEHNVMRPLADGSIVTLRKGDHADQLQNICSCLETAKGYATNIQAQILTEISESFKTGDMERYRNSQKMWIKDINPKVETIIGFVEPYRDPMNIRAEFEGLVAIVADDETRLLSELVDSSALFIKDLPWTQLSTANDGKGHFEKGIFQPPDFTSLHTLAYCSSIIFPGINLPNYNDIRETCGFKNVMIANQISIESVEDESVTTFVDPAETSTFLAHKPDTFYLWVVLHELFGHGTGKLLSEHDANGAPNFDIFNPPENPLTGKKVETWYKNGQTWTSIFADIATTVDECRAECVGAYLISNKELLRLFGFTEESNIKPADIEYNMYMLLATGGLRALENYSAENQSWGQAHSRGHFAILRYLLDADKFITVTADSVNRKLQVHVDRGRIASHGRPKLGEFLLKLHIYRCTADVQACRTLYESLTRVEGVFLEWSEIVLSKPRPKRLYVQPNTFYRNGNVELKEYDATVEGIIQSWAERDV